MIFQAITLQIARMIHPADKIGEHLSPKTAQILKYPVNLFILPFSIIIKYIRS